MDANHVFEAIAEIEGWESPWSCPISEGCNHVAKGPFRMFLHYGFGTHHMNHRKKAR